MTRLTLKEKSLTIATIMLIVFIILIGLSSCADRATRQLKRAEKLTQKAIANGAKVAADTVIKEVALITTEVKTDTVFQSAEGDTVTIEKDRLKIKYVNLPADSVFIEGQCMADTIVKRIPVAVYKKISSGHTTWDMVILAIFCLPVGWLLISFVVIPLARRRKFRVKRL